MCGLFTDNVVSAIQVTVIAVYYEAASGLAELEELRERLHSQHQLPETEDPIHEHLPPTPDRLQVQAAPQIIVENIVISFSRFIN